MKKFILSLAIIAMSTAIFTSCEKGDLGNDDYKTGIGFEAAAVEGMVHVSSSNYERVVAETLVQPAAHNSYTAGKIEYVENGVVTTSVIFNDAAGEKAIIKTDNGDKELYLKDGKGDWDKDGECDDKEDWSDKDKEDWKDKGDWEYEKVVVEPLVKADDCDYIVAGTIEFFKGDEWVATIDYGDGTCDDLATKTTADSEEVHTFSLDEWK